jgi:hypothetical protein
MLRSLGFIEKIIYLLNYLKLRVFGNGFVRSWEVGSGRFGGWKWEVWKCVVSYWLLVPSLPAFGWE